MSTTNRWPCPFPCVATLAVVAILLPLTARLSADEQSTPVSHLISPDRQHIAYAQVAVGAGGEQKVRIIVGAADGSHRRASRSMRKLSAKFSGTATIASRTSRNTARMATSSSTWKASPPVSCGCHRVAIPFFINACRRTGGRSRFAATIPRLIGSSTATRSRRVFQGPPRA